MFGRIAAQYSTIYIVQNLIVSQRFRFERESYGQKRIGMDGRIILKCVLKT